MTQTSQTIAGSLTAGCISTLIGHSLDTIKVHQQSNPQFRTSHSLHVAGVLIQTNGLFKLLFQGIGAPMMNQVVMNTVMFSVFNQAKEFANTTLQQHDSNTSLFGPNSTALFAGLISGFAIAFISTPTDWIKIQAQLSVSERIKHQHTNTNNKNTTTKLSIFKNALWSNGGAIPLSNVMSTLYRGHVANLGREGIFTMIYLGLYDAICQKVQSHSNYHTPHPSMSTVMVVSSLTGACAWIGSYPFDTIKTVIQSRSIIQNGTTLSADSNITMKQAIQSIYQSGGVKAFFRGAGSSTFRAMLVTSSRMIVYEKTIQSIQGTK